MILEKLPQPIQEHSELRKYIEMKFIREVELLISVNYSKQQFRCPVHLSIGQEGVAVGVTSNLKTKDKVISTHRSHAHYLAKGGDLFRMLTELMGSPRGCCGGRGGSMHLFDDEVGFMASIPIVGSSTPIASGLAYAQKIRQTGNVAVSFVGDAVLETGAFYETLNLAAVKALPLLIVIEDNGYSTYADKSVRAPATRDVQGIVSGIGLDFISGNGDKVLEVADISKLAIEKVRQNVPVVLQFSTFRRYEHCGPNIDDSLGYRETSEIESYAVRDPIEGLKLHILSDPGLTSLQLDSIELQIESHIKSVYEAALADGADLLMLLGQGLEL